MPNFDRENSFDNDDHSRIAGPDYLSPMDERILHEVRQRVGKMIRVRVHDGVVVLSGEVPDRKAKSAVEKSLYGISGVKDILNGLTLEIFSPKPLS